MKCFAGQGLPKPVLVRLRNWNVDGHCLLVVFNGTGTDSF